MIPFNLVRVESLKEALDFLSLNGKDTKIIAGGTDLMVELRDIAPNEKGPDTVLDITPVKGLKGIEDNGETITIGALTTHHEIKTSPIILQFARLLAEACSTIGATQHRNIATIGGNIINGSPAADSVPALIALNAEVVFQSTAGKRISFLKDIYIKPYRTDIQPNEILTSIRFPRLPENARSAYIKLGRRNALAISRMNVAVVLIFQEGKIIEARISPGSTTPTPDRITPAEKILIDREPSEKLFQEAGAAVSEEMIRLSGRRWSTPYKEPVIAALTARALRKAVGMGL